MQHISHVYEIGGGGGYFVIGSRFDLLNVIRPPFCTHSCLNWVDEDEIGLKEKPEDTRCIKKIISKQDLKHRECGQRLDPNFAIFGTADSGKVQVLYTRSHLGGGGGGSWPTTGPLILIPQTQ